ncbi:translation initiation factor IF-2 [Hydrococcus rivularis NIES-593]|uniref:Translation initiation factor IF-2 n=1 Tax=Hydrococcus rivularis NIES-593 TaxID=1921803 RepID=A0A1U7HSU5_9CYAN|nr:translation initiation factor IF-2 [Hydrococcus rivularis]OKH26629.1 translation initiation factor IF-2 [Hydrococcus rivularis NIES-593]
MNNGKVRIYELSKELNLDNKDILEICDRLNIAVKSHSSTITETEAGRIKVMAEKYTPSQAARKSHGAAQDKGSDRSSPTAKSERKQQILAIHHKQDRPSATADAQASAQLATPPRPPVKSQPPTPPTSPQASRPATAPSLAVATSQAEAPKQPSKSQPPQTEEPTTTAARAEAPQMLKPPMRLTQPTVAREKEAGRQPSAESAQATQAATAQPIQQVPRKTEKALSEPGVRAMAEKPAEKRQTPIQLELKRPPQRPQERKPVLEESVEATVELEAEPLETARLEGEELLDLSKKPKQKLKRPTLPRSAKSHAWEEEEEEEQRETVSKVGKVSGKGKRRPVIVDDLDEEDLEDELESTVIPSSISLSTARPPKPKSLESAAATGAKARKAAPKADSSAVKAKAERRDRKEVVQRPDKIVLTSSLTVRELAQLLVVPETEIIKNLFLKGIPINITQTLDLETARLVAEELGTTVETAPEEALAAKSTEMIDVADLENLQRRPPVVTIMGHVDHGKTTLLDSIRKTKVAQGEAGGITQHIGAYHVDVEHDGKQEQIVFLDTPGHEAFTAMRARGARVTDIAVLVVAADDGVQPQTREAISHARAAGVPIVVAVNKIDKPEANPDRVKQELSELGLVPEEWGGDTIMVPVSALKGENLDGLLEMILLVSELEELSANPDRPAKGTVIEANLDRTRGPVATLLVQNGTLRVGDIIVAGSVFGKIRAMIDDRGEKVEVATPSFAVEVLGLNDVPAAGDEFEVFENEKEARTLAERRAEEKRQSRLQQAMSSRRVTLADISAQAQEGELKELNLILKADVQGSVEAILGALQQLPQKEVQIRVLLAAPGEITETDVDLAAASGAVIIGFNTTLASGARAAADREGVDIREYDIIYKLLDDVQGAMEGLLEPEEIESPLGQAEVRAVFPAGRGMVAGCYVQSGKIIRNRYLRVRRGGQVIHEGMVDSLKRFTEDAREVAAGYECGIGTAKFNDWKQGDIIEVYEKVMKRRTLSV